MSLKRVAVACSVAAILVGISARADAAPPTTSITAIHDADRCSGTPCGSGEATLAKNAISEGSIEVHWRATSDTGLDFVRLEARIDGAGPWWCVQRWDPTGSLNASEVYRWNTKSWPEINLQWRCTDEGDPDHKHGEPTANGRYEFRMLARNITGEQATSSAFPVRFNNPPVRPAWAADPSGTEPPVSMRWFGNLEPDLVMYRMDRKGPGGEVDTVLIDPSPQASSGCRIEDGPYLVCDDARFGGRNSGTYTYTLTAVRRAVTGDPCRGIAACRSSLPSEARSVKLTLPSNGSGAAPLPSKSAAAALPSTIGSNPAAVPSTPPSTGAQPTQSAREVAVGDSDEPPSRALPIGLAVVLLAGIGIALTTDYFRWSRREGAEEPDGS